MIKVFDPLEYKKIKIDSKSTSFCGAKYYLATMWLQAGMTASCHHNPSHAIDINEIALNPSALHNTKQKKQEREDMRQGLKPSGCHYCWNIESIGDLAVSDRIWNSHANSDEELDQAFAADYNENFNLTRLEISFDRTCQFACSYCSPWVSSSWHKDIKINGTYKNLEVETRRQYTSPVDNDMPYAPNESNPYIDAFFKWWESDLHKTLKELRITGGEPFMSGHFWRLIDWLQRIS
jgi:hypothetical protein